MINFLRLLSLAVLLWCSIGYAQENTSFINGKIVVHRGSVDAISVINATKNASVLSDKYGYFSISSQVGDTLKFISPNYIEYTYVVNEFDIKRNPVLFPLEPLFTMNQLDEIVITKIDSDALGITNQYTKRHTPAERQLKKATTGGGIIPVDPIVNYFTGRTAMLKKAVAYEKEGTRTEKLLDLVSRDRLVSYYKIPADYVDSFAYYAVSKPEVKEVLNASVIDTRYLERYLTPIVFEFIELINKSDKEPIDTKVK
ncbi:hypothetical protein HX039_01045 [Myroides marinus]|uniref:hypothetical protein n=1 Tax=Myroides marinus TaxID=703342 RepID=UPI002576EE33|nr:hypothetical protein [Myroides marinus]MDM1402694.1 hypothetical protein [Myroides marinus]